ncbi:hypothetical protein AB4Y32_12050 [Paraburkholderia phymatum]|uniref:Uncharacterized protein n=1 Tax=Paraburkholderia phymatum TaxID=148447 RepID=A0ACC6TYW9_9BURK
MENADDHDDLVRGNSRSAFDPCIAMKASAIAAEIKQDRIVPTFASKKKKPGEAPGSNGRPPQPSGEG